HWLNGQASAIAGDFRGARRGYGIRRSRAACGPARGGDLLALREALSQPGAGASRALALRLRLEQSEQALEQLLWPRRAAWDVAGDGDDLRNAALHPVPPR